MTATRRSTAPTTASRSTTAPRSARTGRTSSSRPATRSTTSPTSPGASSSPRARTCWPRPGSRCSRARPAPSDLIMMMLQSAGASLFDDEGNPTISDNDALMAAIDMYTGTRQVRCLRRGQLLGRVHQQHRELATLPAPSTACGSPARSRRAEDQSGKWAITNLPKIDGVAGATNFSANGGSSWAISANANTSSAADFLAATFAGSTDFYDTILPSSGALANWLPAGDRARSTREPQPFFGGEPIFAKVARASRHRCPATTRAPTTTRVATP